ncbi:MAG: enoyl-CoA hydratase/isomerase family protein [Actinomycetota bacterium]
MPRHVTLRVSERVGTIRLNRPPVNALDEDLVHDLVVVVGEAVRRDDVEAVVFTGGSSVFAAGADIQMMARLSPAEIAPITTAMQDAFSMIERMPMVTIAAINGYALGGGCELSLCTDFRYAADDARLGQPEILLGIIPGSGGTQRLPGLVGVSRAKELIYSGRQIEAAEAKAIGLVDQVFPPDEVLERAHEAARRFAVGPLLALRAAKEAIRVGAAPLRDVGLALERHALIALFGSEDQRQGMKSFLERGLGMARFRGR